MKIVSMIRRHLYLMAAAASLASTSQAVLAQAHPTKPIQLINTSAEGGAGDFVARVIAEKLPVVLGQPVTVENRPGASGITGARDVARAPPDGHVVLVGHTAEIAILPHFASNLGYNPQKDLQPVSLIALFPLALVVKNTVQQTTLKDFLAQSRASSRGLLFASSGPGTPGHLAGELVRLRTGARLAHVPYDGGGPAVQNVLAGRVDFYFSSLAAAMRHITSGQLKALAVSTARRSPILPNVPTVAESGIRGFDLGLWIGIFVPRATPRDLVLRLNRALNEILAEPNLSEQVKREGGEIVPMSPEQFAGFVKSESERYAELLQEEFCSRLLFGGCLGFGTLAD
jgi:tripartite-type tricarboxylate transporter receptor subunit TctC